MNSNSLSKKNYKTGNTLFTIFIAGYFGFLIYLTGKVNLWVDEVFTLKTTALPIHEVLGQAYHFEGQPPFYFLLLSLWRLFSQKVIFAKLFSIIMIGLSAYSLNSLLELNKLNKSRKWIILIFLTNPFTIWAALELRTYSLLIFLSILCFNSYLRYVRFKDNKYLYALIFISILGVYTQYFFAFLIMAIAFSHLISFGWKKFIAFCLYLSPVAIIALPNASFAAEQLHVIRPRNVSTTDVQLLLNILRTPQNFLLGMQLIPFGRATRWAIKLLLIMGLFYTFFNLYKRRSAYQNIIDSLKTTIVTASMLIILILTAVLSTHILYMDKYLSISFPYFIILFSGIEIFNKQLIRIISFLIILYYISIQFPFFLRPIKGFDFKTVGRLVSKIELKNEPLLFYNNSLALTFKYYYTGHNAIYPLPHEVRFDTSFMHSLRDVKDLRESISKIPPHKSYLFISDLFESPYFPELSRAKTDSFLNKNYNITFDTLIYGEKNLFPIRIRRIEGK